MVHVAIMLPIILSASDLNNRYNRKNYKGNNKEKIKPLNEMQE